MRRADEYRKHLMEFPWRFGEYFSVPPARRLEDRIRNLCGKAVPQTDSELAEVLFDLRAALHEHTQRFRELITIGRRTPYNDRRGKKAA